MAADMSREEERRGSRRVILWGMALAAVLGVIALIATPLANWINPNRTGQDQVATSFPRVSEKSTEPVRVESKESAGIGPYLTDAHGRALYIFEGDERGGDGKAPVSKCYDNCAKSWPPFVSSSSPQASAGADPELLSTVDRGDGEKQVTYNGWPLYRFVRDAGPTRATGQSIDDFGAEWHLISPTGETVKGAPPSG